MYRLTDQEIEDIVLWRLDRQKVKDIHDKCRFSVRELRVLVESSKWAVKEQYKEMLSKYLYKLQVVFNFKSSHYVPVQWESTNN